MKNKEIHLRNLDHYMSYAFAVYGCTMYLIDNDDRCNHCLSLFGRLSPFSCCCCLPSSRHLAYTEDDNCCLGNAATLKLKVPHIEEEDIIHFSLKNSFLATPFAVVADNKLQRIIVAIRGTLSLADVMTDMVARPVSLKAFLRENLNLSGHEESKLQEMPEQLEVHQGMAEAALYVFQEIKSKHLLDKAYVEYPDYPLVVTGHSLGAGTAVILSFILKLKYSGVNCFAFGPPGGLLSRTAWEISGDFVTSVVVGDDIIPRLSFNGYLHLRNQMKKALLSCKLPKHKVLATGLCNCLSPLTWIQRLRQDPSVTNVDLEGEILTDYGSTVVEMWQEMLPPGKIIHIFSNQDSVNMCFRDPKELSEILISAKMINDHSPSSYQKMIARAIQRFTHNNVSDLNPSV